MSDVAIFIFGAAVFGVSLLATMVLVIPPTQKDAERRRRSADKTLPDPSYTP